MGSTGIGSLFSALRGIGSLLSVLRVLGRVPVSPAAGSMPSQPLKPPKCCSCNSSGTCKNCSCCSKGRSCGDCVPGKHGRCVNRPGHSGRSLARETQRVTQAAPVSNVRRQSCSFVSSISSDKTVPATSRRRTSSSSSSGVVGVQVQQVQHHLQPCYQSS